MGDKINESHHSGKPIITLGDPSIADRICSSPAGHRDGIAPWGNFGGGSDRRRVRVAIDVMFSAEIRGSEPTRISVWGHRRAGY